MAPLVRVLLVDDSQAEYRLLSALFSEIEGVRYQLDWAATYAAGLELIGRRQHDVVFIDYRLSHIHTGLDLLREAVSRGCRAPLILITEKGTREVDLQAMESGAVDFLVKWELTPGLLERSIRYALNRKKTEELEDQIRQAQKMEAVGRLAGGIAHDFNNLLFIIIGYGDILRRRFGGDDRLKGYLEEILKAGHQAAGLTHQLLAFSRKQVLEPRILDLNALLTDLERMLRRLIGEDVELTIGRDLSLWPMKADPGQIEQVVLNLAANARDAMPEGGRLAIQTANVDVENGALRPEMPPGRYVLLTVADSGLGMDEETRSHLFEPFFTTKEVGRGTGLGLATVYGVIQQSGGYIFVDSEVNHGTSVKIYFPQAEKGPRSEVARRGPATVPGGKETILLVEDDDGVRKLERLALEEKGYHILEASNGNQALEVSEQFEGSIDLLATDVIMPKLSGRKLVDLLSPVRPHMKVLYLSGYTNDTLGQYGLVSSEVSFLHKPCPPDVLAGKVREVLDRAV